MDIKDLTERMHAFVRSKGWYEPDSTPSTDAAQPGDFALAGSQ